MAVLHYGTDRFDINGDDVAAVVRSITANRAGGWVKFIDSAGTAISILLSPGVPVWIDAHLEPVQQVIPRRLN